MSPQLHLDNSVAVLASLYPAACDMVAGSNSRFNLVAQRPVLPALPARRRRPDPWPDNNLLQFTVRASAPAHQLAA